MTETTSTYDNIVVAVSNRVVKEDASEEIIEYPNTPMHDENGAIRMRPGWEGVFLHDEVIGKPVPYACQKTVIFADAQDARTFWAINHATGKYLMITAPELTNSSFPNALIQVQTYRAPNFHPRQSYQIGAPITVDIPGHGETACRELSIYVPLSRLFEVRKTTPRLTDPARAKLIRKHHPQRKSYYFTAALMSEELCQIVKADDPAANLVKIGDEGKFTHREFVETVHYMFHRKGLTEVKIEERGYEVVRVGERRYVHVTDGDVTEVQLFEAWHDKRVRRYWRELGSRGIEDDGAGS